MNGNGNGWTDEWVNALTPVVHGEMLPLAEAECDPIRKWVDIRRSLTEWWRENERSTSKPVHKKNYNGVKPYVCCICCGRVFICFSFGFSISNIDFGMNAPMHTEISSPARAKNERSSLMSFIGQVAWLRAGDAKDCYGRLHKKQIALLFHQLLSCIFHITCDGLIWRWKKIVEPKRLRATGTFYALHHPKNADT